MPARVTWIGHATVLIEMDGMRILTDPVLRDRIGPLRRRAKKPHFGRLGHLDAILISHLHLDHCDLPSLRLLHSSTRVIGPPGTAKLLAKCGFSEVDDVKKDLCLRVGDVKITTTHAEHDGQRHPLSPDTSDSIGYVLRGESAIYFAGDTSYFGHMDKIGGDLDLALLPISAWAPQIKLEEHMSPALAAESLRLLRPRMTVPIHWGTYTLPGTARYVERTAGLETGAFAHAASHRAPDVAVHVLRPGESLEL